MCDTVRERERVYNRVYSHNRYKTDQTFRDRKLKLANVKYIRTTADCIVCKRRYKPTDVENKQQCVICGLLNFSIKLFDKMVVFD